MLADEATVAEDACVDADEALTLEAVDVTAADDATVADEATVAELEVAWLAAGATEATEIAADCCVATALDAGVTACVVAAA